MGKPAATIGSLHVCPKTTGTVPHVGGPIVGGSGSVLNGGLLAARVSDKFICIGLIFPQILMAVITGPLLLAGPAGGVFLSFIRFSADGGEPSNGILFYSPIIMVN